MNPQSFAQKQKQEYLRALRANVPVIQDRQDIARLKMSGTVYQWVGELQVLKGKDQQGKSEKTIKAYKLPARWCGTAQQFTAVGTFTDGSSQDITSVATWNSAVPSVATISNSGLASALLSGVYDYRYARCGIKLHDLDGGICNLAIRHRGPAESSAGDGYDGTDECYRQLQ